MSVEIGLVIIFLIAYSVIIFEHSIGVDKSGPALLGGILMWAAYALGTGDFSEVNSHFGHHLSDIAGILLFLMGAMTIVEIIDMHDGFHVIVGKITTKNKRKLLWVVSFISFFLSAVLDNLTASIVMVSLLTKLVSSKYERMLFGGMIIIAANAGGAWSPIGDITTTMLWIGGQITTIPTIEHVFLPSLACMLLPLIVAGTRLKGDLAPVEIKTVYKTTHRERLSILALGIGCLIFVPVFKMITHLPPFMGMFFGVGVLWLTTDAMHKGKKPNEKTQYSVYSALSHIDMPSVLFFFGILASIASLESLGTLDKLAEGLDHTFKNRNIIVILMGVFSAIIDNVPLVAASMGMYNLTDYPTDHFMWQFIAYCAGTGGSMLIIGSAAGVAVMGIQKINFIWYLKNITPLAVLGYISGLIVFLLIN